MKTCRKRSQLQEKGVAKDLGAKTIVASGALWNAKGDVRNNTFLIECKTTEKAYYPISLDIWDKIRNEAISDRFRIPLLVVDLEDSIRYVVFDNDFFDYQVCDSSSLVGDKKQKKFMGIGPGDLAEVIGLSRDNGKTTTRLVVMGIKDFKRVFKKEIGGADLG